MNPEALLALISDLYTQLANAQRELALLREQHSQNGHVSEPDAAKDRA